MGILQRRENKTEENLNSPFLVMFPVLRLYSFTDTEVKTVVLGIRVGRRGVVVCLPGEEDSCLSVCVVGLQGVKNVL